MAQQSLRGLSSEQMLIIVDELLEHYPDRIRSYSALAGIAAITTTRFHGIAVHSDPDHLAADAAEAVTRLRPLATHNDVLASIVASTLLELNSDFRL